MSNVMLKLAVFGARIPAVFLCLSMIAGAQTPAASAGKATASRAPAKASGTAGAVDNVIQLVKSGMSESLIIRTLKKQNQPVNLTSADLVKLQGAGVSENIINILEDPTSTPSPNATGASQGSAGSAPAPVVTAAAANSLVAAANSKPVATPVSAPAMTPTPVPANATKKRVAVDDFDYAAVMTSVQAVFGTNQNIGKGIRAMLTNKLAQQGKVVLVERTKIDMLQKEQDRNAGNRVKQGSGARVGRISGVDAMLLGDITIFGRDDKKKGVAAGGLGGTWWGGAAGAIANSRKEEKAVVAVTYRLVDAETSEVIASGEARGESSRKSNNFGAALAGWNRGAYGAGAASVDMTSSNFAETIIGEATQDCVNKLADIMNTQSEAMKKAAHEVEATVADVAGSSVTITAGANDGVLSGDVFEVLRVVREVKDPGTNEVLDRITEKVGEMTIVNVRDKIATGNYSGAQNAAIAYVARKKL